jgi:radical SAM protein with 4Fe4S-binding SPASM domain
VSYVDSGSLPDLGIWDKLKARRAVISFDLEITARCNNACRHCYIALPAGDREAQRHEMSLAEIDDIAARAADLGAVWVLLSGGEPLLRPDFADIYLALKRRGLLVSVFTNACLVTPEHVALFRRYPPRDIEVSVYGATAETYERVTQRPGSFAAFSRGLDLLLGAGVKVRLKAMALRSNVHELDEIAAFCRARTKDYYRFDPLLHLRFDGDEQRNEQIRAERLSPGEIVTVERADEQRFGALQKGCADGRLIFAQAEGAADADHADHTVDAAGLPLHPDGSVCDHLFHCGAGNGSFSIGYDGTFRLCSSLWHPDCTVSVRPGDRPTLVSLREAWEELVPRVHALRSQDPVFLTKCRRCALVNLCLWCPAHAHLETGSGEQGRLDAVPDYFCRVAHARAAALTQRDGEPPTEGAEPPAESAEPPAARTHRVPPGHPEQGERA